MSYVVYFKRHVVLDKTKHQINCSPSKHDRLYMNETVGLHVIANARESLSKKVVKNLNG